MATVKSLGIRQPTGLRHAVAEELLPPDPTSDLYQWEIFTDSDDGAGGADELLTTPHGVVWSRGGIFQKSFKFDVEDETVTQALLTRFPTNEDDRNHPDKNGSGRKGQERPLSKALVVFLKSQAHIYFLSGASHAVHMPFEVESACAAPCGVIIQRKARTDGAVPITLKFPRVPPNSFVSSQVSPVSQRLSQQPFSTAGLGKPKQLPLRLSMTLENMWQPPLEKYNSNWPRLVCLTDPLLELGLVVTQPGKMATERRPKSSITSPFLDAAEEMLHIETIRLPGEGQAENPDDLVLAVTVNRESSMYSVWRLSYIQNGDQFTSRQRKPKTKASRRRSSMQPGLASGATTPLQPSFRESLGPPLPMKKTRRSEKVDRSLEAALSLEADKAEEVTRRQSRRVSSHVVRDNLSASHERSLFVDQPAATNATGRRVDSYGSQRGRTSSGYAANNPSGAYNQTLNSLLEAPVDDLDEPRAGGDFDGFHSMAPDDSGFEGLTKEILLTKIQSVPMDNANVRYSLSDTPARNQCKVFIVVSSPFAVDEKDRNYLLICIQDPVDKRLQLLTLHIQTRSKLNFAGRAGKKPAPNEGDSTTVTWGPLRRAQNVVDSCKIYDGDQSMILILSEGDEGQRQLGMRQLSIQAPWSELTTVTLPLLFRDDPNSLEYAGSYVKKDTETRRSTGAGIPSPQIDSLWHPQAGGLVDVQDKEGQFHRLRIKLQPSCVQTRRVLEVCRSVLPAEHAEKMLAGWWHIMQWLRDEHNVQASCSEWSALVIELFVIFLALGHSDISTLKADGTAARSRARPSSSHGLVHWKEMQACTTPNTAPCPSWMQRKGWRWLLDDGIWSNQENIENVAPTDDSFLSRHIRYAKTYSASTAGMQAIGRNGYLPTAFASGLSLERRRSAAWGIAMALHLLSEEQKLDIMLPECLSPGPADLRVVLCQITRWLRWHNYVARYELGVQADVGPQHDLELNLSPPLPGPATIPCIFEWIQSRLTWRSSERFPTLADVYGTSLQQGEKDVPGESRWELITPRTFLFQRFFQLLKSTDSYVETVEAMHNCGFTPSILETLPEAVLAPLQDAISMCQQRPPAYWSTELLQLVNRSDMSTVLGPRKPPLTGNALATALSHVATWDFRVLCETKDDMNNMGWDEVEGAERQAVVQALFKDDKRLHEVQHLLSPFKPRVIRLDALPKWTESEYLERQKELVTIIATSTLAMPAGRGMLQYGFRFPLLTQKFNIHGFNLTCVVKPTNVAVGVDKSMFTEEKVNWAFFHQGVAFGLAISPQAKGIDTSWILYNKPGNDLNNRHAGFLLALGLNGHLKSVAKWVAFKYLTPKHTMTSIGLLLGLAASHLGTMDSLITRLLSVHVTRMLPRGAAELNLSHHTQTTGIMGIGLLYCNSQHRRMSEIMMSEIEFVEDEDEEDPLRNEGYRLAAGFALGFINLGKGNDLKGLHDMRITEKLLTLASSTKKVELVNVLDRSAAGAVVAIALIFMKSEDHIVARKIDVPDSILQFDYVRPDILLLRTVAKNLIMWNQIEPTFEWIRGSLPSEYRGHSNLKSIKRTESRDLPFFSILAGLCFAIALRFAGSANLRVRDLLVHYLDQFMRIVRTPAERFDLQLARGSARMCMDLLALSCATVMAGTGDLIVLRRLRSLHGRDDPHTTYGSHLAAHLAIGALFLGSGMVTFGTSDLAVASLLVAFYPLFPATVQDNRSHLQAFRHFWVLATDPRCLIVRDMATGQPISVPVHVYMKKEPHRHLAGISTPSKSKSRSTKSASTKKIPASDESILQRHTPCLLPPLEGISSVRTAAGAQGYWDLELDFERKPELIKSFRENQNLYLRRRPGHEGVFSSTLQALGCDATAPNVSDISARPAVPRQGRVSDPLEWIFSVNSLKELTHAERALVLDQLAGSGGGEGNGAGSVVDARLALEGGMDGWSRDSLLGLRLLFDWADKRASAEHTSDEKGKRKAEDLDCGSEGKGWWMRDSIIDMLKGKVWLAGQEE